jgi:hypothetical protein
VNAQCVARERHKRPSRTLRELLRLGKQIHERSADVAHKEYSDKGLVASRTGVIAGDEFFVTSRDILSRSKKSLLQMVVDPYSTADSP